jgi:hypothetical protein
VSSKLTKCLEILQRLKDRSAKLIREVDFAFRPISEAKPDPVVGDVLGLVQAAPLLNMRQRTAWELTPNEAGVNIDRYLKLSVNCVKMRGA